LITDAEILPSGNPPLTADSALKTEVMDFKLSDAGFKVQAVPGNSTGESFISQKLFTKQPEPQNDKRIPPPPRIQKPESNTLKYILILAVMAVLVFAVGAFGLYAIVSLMNYEKPSKEDNTAIENTNLPKTPETTPSVKESVNTTEGNTDTNTETNTETNTGTNTEIITNTGRKETQKTPTPVAQPSVTPTSKIIVEQTPKSTPTAIPTVNKTPPKEADYYVVCHVKTSNGVEKIRKNRCSECPKETLCELIFK